MNPVVLLTAQELGVGGRSAGGWALLLLLLLLQQQLICYDYRGGTDPASLQLSSVVGKTQEKETLHKSPSRARPRVVAVVLIPIKTSADTFNTFPFISMLLYMHQIPHQGQSVTDCRLPRRSTSSLFIFHLAV